MIMLKSYNSEAEGKGMRLISATLGYSKQELSSLLGSIITNN